MNNEKHKVTWDLPEQVHDRLAKLAKAKGRRTSTQNLGIVLLERGVEDEERRVERENIRMNLQLKNGIQVINDCLTINALDSAYSYVKLFTMAYDANKEIEAAYEAKKELLIY